ncbi:MAG TPA: ATP-binding protein [Actinophytocola sp.]|uniref:ATP-binding protein n=1 Tax=Actinophytocola sp. TaxID=1872138 RepID=UPI002DDCE46B|nr:ATP-binding protein [Actinophytocola sp.]HEV2778355.1 ATP-binding protein [Actinophytocola sp.]
MPEPGHQNPARWHVNAWSLRTKVAVVLLLPAAVALVLGGLRVQSQLDEASRLSAIRDQMTMLGDAVALTNLVSDEMVAATPPGGPDLETLQKAVDERAASVQRRAVTTGLPAELSGILSEATGQLSELRRQAASPNRNPTNETAGYLDVVNGLSELAPGIVGTAGDDDLERPARAVTYLLRLRGILAIEEIVLRFSTGSTPVDAGTGQRSAAEEQLLSEQIRRDLPPADVAAFDRATATAQDRRDTYQAAFVGAGTITPATLLPGLESESQGLADLATKLVGNLGDTVSARTNQARSEALRDAAIVLGALLAALAIALIVARSLLAPVRVLRSAALRAAHHRLPETVERVRLGERVDWRTIEPVPVRTEEEIGQLARAFDDMHQQAVRLAGEQAELRRQVSEMFTTLSRRSQSLVELQLEVIETLESDEQDPKRLEGLFRLDHLATRLRRNGENLQVLAGGTPARRGQGPVTVVELLRAATSEVNDYTRISLGHAPNGSVRGSAAADVVHILAELLENATRYSSPERKVVLTADRGSDGGLLIEVVDAGLGMAPDDLAAANQRLAASDDVGPETTRRMGLFVVSRLAARHGVTVRLRPTYEGAKQSGITASVHVPATLVIADGTPQVPAVPRIPAAPQAPAALVAPAAPSPPIAPVAKIVAPEPLGTGHNWFVPLTPVTSPVAEPVIDVPTTRTTAAGLPMRKPGARVLPIPAREPAAARVGFRDPESIRSNLARHYDGVRAARQRTQTESEAQEGS